MLHYVLWKTVIIHEVMNIVFGDYYYLQPSKTQM